MKIIHTSDWHLGQGFIGKSREAEHKAFLNWLLVQIEEQRIDAVIVAGDIFDTGTPPSYARKLYNEFIVAMHKVGCQLVVLGGNHDSVSTLQETESLLSCLGTRVIGGVAESPEEQLVLLNNSKNEPGAILCGIPFIRAKDVMNSTAGQSGRDKQRALIKAMEEHFQSVFDAALKRRESLGLNLPIISTGHLTTLASSRTESVRDIYVGTLESFPSDKLPDADYIALGHLHKPLTVGGKEHIRYCGSPIPLSFDELDHDKEVLVVELDETGLVAINPLTVPRSQPMHRVSGSLSCIEKQFSNITEGLGSEGSVAWVEVEVSTHDYLTDLQQKVTELCEGKPIEVIKVKRKRNSTRLVEESYVKQALSELSPHDVFQKRVEQESLTDEEVNKLTASFKEVVSEVQSSLTPQVEGQ